VTRAQVPGVDINVLVMPLGAFLSLSSPHGPYTDGNDRTHLYLRREKRILDERQERRDDTKTKIEEKKKRESIIFTTRTDDDHTLVDRDSHL